MGAAQCSLCPTSFYLPDSCWVPRLPLVVATWQIQGQTKLSVLGTKTALFYTYAHPEGREQLSQKFVVAPGLPWQQPIAPQPGAKKKRHLVSSIAFSHLFKLGTELRSCCHLKRLLKSGKASAVVVLGTLVAVRCQESQPQSLGVNDITGWWVLSALPLVLPTQPFSCLNIFVCLGCLCAGARFGPSNTVSTASQSSHCSVCRRDTPCLQPGPLDVVDSNASFYRRVDSPAWDCIDL